MAGFDGRAILVTGASGGIGGATVRRLVAEGADVIASGRNEDALAALAAETGCRALPFDLESEASVEGALRGLDLWGAVNCGGWGGATTGLALKSNGTPSTSAYSTLKRPSSFKSYD